MVAVIVILVILVLIIYLLQRLKINILINLSESNFSADVFCLYPILYIRLNIEESRPILLVNILKIQVYRKPLHIKKNRHKTSLLRYADFENMQISTYYGLGNPFVTGMFTGLLGMAKTLPFPVQLNHYPDFFAANEYLRIDVSGYLKLGTTIKNYMINR